ncbi:hypothetical protein CY35_09G092300 [Sphagnum magellanicum]|nr:hypothetical protein CY35_09G092300 [Sphagnum magellanicum]
MATALVLPSLLLSSSSSSCCSSSSCSSTALFCQAVVCDKQDVRSHNNNSTTKRGRRNSSSRSLTSLAIRSSKAEGPLRRPSAPAAPSVTTSDPSFSPAPPPPPSSPPTPTTSAPSSSPPSSSSSAPAAVAASSSKLSSSVSIEYQRQRAKEMQEYFLDKKFEEQIRAGRLFGWTRKNEIGNGRWAMFGIAVGLLTEYATGSSFVEQLKIIISNLGIADLD